MTRANAAVSVFVSFAAATSLAQPAAATAVPSSSLGVSPASEKYLRERAELIRAGYKKETPQDRDTKSRQATPKSTDKKKAKCKEGCICSGGGETAFIQTCGPTFVNGMSP